MRMTRTLIVTVALAVAGSPAGADDAKKHDPRAAFAETDENRDGVVDHEEFHERIVEVFYSADRNKDGVLEVAELKELVFADDFTDDDKDHNGRVSMQEFLRVRFRDYHAADKDDDEVLSLDEVVTAYEGKKRR